MVVNLKQKNNTLINVKSKKVINNFFLKYSKTYLSQKDMNQNKRIKKKKSIPKSD